MLRSILHVGVKNCGSKMVEVSDVPVPFVKITDRFEVAPAHFPDQRPLKHFPTRSSWKHSTSMSMISLFARSGLC